MATPETSAVPTREIALSAAWQAQSLTGQLLTRDGRKVDVINRGTWTHGFGPDFRDAMISLDGRELRSGSIEIHLTTRGWVDHGHDRDARYNDVVLHVVLDDDGTETRREDGMLVPVVGVRDRLTAPLSDDGIATGDWSRFGGTSCAEALTRSKPDVVRQVLNRLGDARLAGRSARLEGQLSLVPPAQVLYEAIWDSLGYQQNREPMREVTRRLPLADLEAVVMAAPRSDQLAVARGLLLGVAGFLPLSPMDAGLAQLDAVAVTALEAAWRTAGAPWHDVTIRPTDWTRARVRPSNHPALRLAQGASLVVNAMAEGGLVAVTLEPVRTRVVSESDRPGRIPDLVGHISRLTGWAERPGVGADRAGAMLASAILPFAMALASQSSDYVLMDGAATAWDRLAPDTGNQVTRRALRQVAGGTSLPRIGARGQQGLIHLDQTLCGPRRCRECPVAQAAVVNAD